MKTLVLETGPDGQPQYSSAARAALDNPALNMMLKFAAKDLKEIRESGSGTRLNWENWCTNTCGPHIDGEGVDAWVS